MLTGIVNSVNLYGFDIIPFLSSNDEVAIQDPSIYLNKFGEFKALNNVSIKIDTGDFTVLLGLNGAGKTTLYSLITRLYNNNSGSIKIHNFEI